MKNIRLATMAKIIIPLFLICAVVTLISFFSYQSAIRYENDLLRDTIESFGVTLAPRITASITDAHATSTVFYAVLTCVVSAFVAIALTSLFIVTYKLAPIRKLVSVAARLASENAEKNDLKIPSDELGDLTRELAFLIRATNENLDTLEDALEKANAASKAKGDFLSNMSHEIRTPINAIIGMTNIAKSARSIDRKDYALGKIGDASTHLLGIINDILDMSKIEAAKLVLHQEPCVFREMIKKTINIINFRVVEKHQKLAVNIDENIPHRIVTDEQRLAQIITNLLSNAVKFTPENGTIDLDAKLLWEGDGICEIRFDITDTGVGISKEQQAKLFDPFEQAESSTTRKYGGTGLGLTIAKRIVESMGGEISVTSTPCEGSTFTFTIKAKKPDETCENGGDADTPCEGESDEVETPDSFWGYRVLLAEDVEINREIVIALLEPTLLEIDCAENGVEAVRMFSEAPDKYNIIFMDVQMPEMDGYDATRKIREMDVAKAKTIPIVAMTANVFKEDIKNCLAVGMDDHIGKPLDFDLVMQILRQHLYTQTPVNDRRQMERRLGKSDRRQSPDRRM